MAFSDLLEFSELDLTGRRVFVRADLDAPVTPLGRLSNDVFIRRLLPVLETLRASRCKVVVAGHANRRDAALMRAVAELLGAHMKTRIIQLGRDLPSQIPKLLEGQIALAPDLSLYPEERSNDARWARALARCIDVYVSEAPSAARETFASTAALPRLMPARAAGPLFAQDLAMTADFVESPSAPFTALIGGSGVLRKARFLRGLLERVDTLLLGGVVANTFLVANGWQPRASRYEPEGLDVALEILEAARSRGVRLVMPTDGVTFTSRSGAPPAFERRELEAFAPDEALLDIGEQTRETYRRILSETATVLWNGRLGEGATEQTLEGTRMVLEAALAAAPYSGVAGDDSVLLASSLGITSEFRWLANGGDATLELLAGVELPGVESLRQPTRAQMAADFDL
jgi:phosphoglycerate kinase